MKNCFEHPRYRRFSPREQWKLKIVIVHMTTASNSFFYGAKIVLLEWPLKIEEHSEPTSTEAMFGNVDPEPLLQWFSLLLVSEAATFEIPLAADRNNGEIPW